MLEKELVLEEVVSLTKKLRKQAADGRAETLQLSKKVDSRVNLDGLIRTQGVGRRQRMFFSL